MKTQQKAITTHELLLTDEIRMLTTVMKQFGDALKMLVARHTRANQHQKPLNTVQFLRTEFDAVGT